MDEFKPPTSLDGLMIVATAPQRSAMGESLARELGVRYVELTAERFPDGEYHARVPERIDGTAVLVGDLRPDERILETVVGADALREAGADEIVLAAPYLAYGRQDRAFEPGEGVSARALLRALSANADAFATVDPHTDGVLDHFDGATSAATAAQEIATHLADEGVDLVLAPDAGARDRAEQVADHLGCPFDHLEKHRKSAHEVEIEPHDADVTGQTVLVVDDIVATGGTMSTATRQLLDAGAGRVLLAATHGVFADGALKRLDDAGAETILATDAIPSSASAISLAPALARAARRARSG
ncbi:ribose-phosphate diphosphokinase [Thermoplasmatales archaeon SW_10_69_26]|nr:MAG: ribose-phosphate diphosphokinase [Thermoplasmatales archaeon SW_10_69_26]